MKKGDRVIVTARTDSGYDSEFTPFGSKQLPDSVEVIYDPSHGKAPSTKYKPGRNARKLFRIQEDHWEGIVVGYSTRYTGTLWRSNALSGPDYQPGYLENVKGHKVWLVQPIEPQRWTPPTPCMEEDLLPIQEFYPQLEGEENE